MAGNFRQVTPAATVNYSIGDELLSFTGTKMGICWKNSRILTQFRADSAEFPNESGSVAGDTVIAGRGRGGSDEPDIFLSNADTSVSRVQFIIFHLGPELDNQVRRF